MRRLFLFIFVLISFAFTDQVKLESECNVRAAPEPKGALIGRLIEKGKLLTVMDRHGSWAKIKIIDGSIHKGKEGWIWMKLLEEPKAEVTLVGGVGATVREGPGKKFKKMFAVKAGASVKVTNIIVTWYKVPYGETSGWIWAGTVSSVPEKKK